MADKEDDKKIIRSNLPQIHIPLVSIGEYIHECLNTFDPKRIILVRKGFQNKCMQL